MGSQSDMTEQLSTSHSQDKKYQVLRSIIKKSKTGKEDKEKGGW